MDHLPKFVLHLLALLHPVCEAAVIPTAFIDVPISKDVKYSSKRVYYGLSKVQCDLKCALVKGKCYYIQKFTGNNQMSVCELLDKVRVNQNEQITTMINSESNAQLSAFKIKPPDVIVHGGWSEWSISGQCSVTCGDGFLNETRQCNNPFPSMGGQDCGANEIRQLKCNEDICPGVYTFHHNNEDEIYIQGYELPDYHITNFYYNNASQDISAVAEKANQCQQYFKYKGKRASMGDTDWKAFDGNVHQFYPSKLGETTCNCSGAEPCCCGRNLRKCKGTEIDEYRFTIDDGHFTNKALLPIIQIRVGDTGNHAEEAYVTLGPFVCTVE